MVTACKGVAFAYRIVLDFRAGNLHSAKVWFDRVGCPLETVRFSREGICYALGSTLRRFSDNVVISTGAWTSVGHQVLGYSRKLCSWTV